MALGETLKSKLAKGHGRITACIAIVLLFVFYYFGGFFGSAAYTVGFLISQVHRAENETGK